MEYRADMLVCDIVEAHPSAKDVLETFGLPCSRCIVAYHETLAQGLRPHGLDPAAVIARLERDAPLPATQPRGKRKKKAPETFDDSDRRS